MAIFQLPEYARSKPKFDEFIERSFLPRGMYERTWDMTGLSKGLYFVRLRAGGETVSSRVLKTN